MLTKTSPLKLSAAFATGMTSRMSTSPHFEGGAMHGTSTLQANSSGSSSHATIATSKTSSDLGIHAALRDAAAQASGHTLDE
jgi:hypothetical protein